ncbi:phosphoinositide phospholipase C 2-like [Dorcoceras hygrometricum]|uniref:Phosphoinositide phospholipase C 2-like n=1 Tax=Dorcoceras hygrometricum TaxID=472368 RepID=A0A2Z7AN04_9LAMI|nr:phosphoinositide phospholipase C 2-like [Dorcoceras hygrometricum]
MRKEDKQLYLSSRWFDKIKFSSWFGAFMESAAGLVMEMSKVKSVVRNQAEANRKLLFTSRLYLEIAIAKRCRLHKLVRQHFALTLKIQQMLFALKPVARYQQSLGSPVASILNQRLDNQLQAYRFYQLVNQTQATTHPVESFNEPANSLPLTKVSDDKKGKIVAAVALNRLPMIKTDQVVVVVVDQMIRADMVESLSAEMLEQEAAVVKVGEEVIRVAVVKVGEEVIRVDQRENDPVVVVSRGSWYILWTVSSA